MRHSGILLAAMLAFGPGQASLRGAAASQQVSPPTSQPAAAPYYLANAFRLKGPFIPDWPDGPVPPVAWKPKAAAPTGWDSWLKEREKLIGSLPGNRERSESRLASFRAAKVNPSLKTDENTMRKPGEAAAFRTREAKAAAVAQAENAVQRMRSLARQVYDPCYLPEGFDVALFEPTDPAIHEAAKAKAAAGR